MNEEPTLITLISLPEEVLISCIWFLEPEYRAWDLWNIGLVNKKLLLYIRRIIDQFPAVLTRSYVTKFKSVITSIVDTSRLDETKMRLNLHQYLDKFKFSATGTLEQSRDNLFHVYDLSPNDKSYVMVNLCYCVSTNGLVRQTICEVPEDEHGFFVSVASIHSECIDTTTFINDLIELRRNKPISKY